jgi:Right handed beta helix region
MQKIKLLILLCTIGISAFARDYFVAPGGVNVGTGGSIGSPLATIQYALSLAQPGDTVQVRTGTYTEKLNWVRSGTAGNLITLKNYLQDMVIVHGGSLPGINLLLIDSKSYIEVKGIIFQQCYASGAKGIYINNEGRNISIKNCTVRNIGWSTNPNADPTIAPTTSQAHGILIAGRTTTGLDSIKVIGTKIHNIISGNSEALTVTGNTDGFELDKDTVYDTKNIGIDAAGHFANTLNTGVDATLNQARNGVISNCLVYDNRRFSNQFAPAGIYVDGGRDIKILNNRSFGNGNGISVGCENTGSKTASNITVMNNVTYDNYNAGLVFGSGDINSVNRSFVINSTVVNNTFFKDAKILAFGQQISLQNTSNCTIVNNIIVPRQESHHGIAIFGFVTNTLTLEKNLFYRYNPVGFTALLYVSGTPSQFTPLDTLNADPGFLDTALTNPNLSINNTSAAINMGSNVYPLVTDIDAAGNYRIVNGMVDIGAFERQDGGCPNIFTINDTHVLKGKFVALQQIIFNRSQPAILTNPMLWSSPLVTLLSPVQLFSAVTVSPAGCN